MQTLLCGSCWLHGLTCGCSARLSRKHPQDASTAPPRLPVPFCTPLSGRSSSHGSAARGNLAAGRRLQTCSPEHLGGAGKSSAPRSATQPVVPADGHSILLLLSPPACPSCPGATLGVGPAPVRAGLRRGGGCATSFYLPCRAVPRACPSDVCLVAGTQGRDGAGTAQRLPPAPSRRALMKS